MTTSKRDLAVLTSILLVSTACVGQVPGGSGTGPATSASTAAAHPSAPASATPATRPSPSSTSVPAPSRIAFVLGRDDGTDEVIVTIRPDGSGEWRVPVDGVSPNEGPAWVPDTNTLLFDSGRTGSIDLFRVDVPGGPVKAITTTPDRFEGFPAVSPDGSRIVFDNGDATRSLGLWQMDLDGTHARQLLAPPSPPVFDSAPAFSADGRWIAFIRKRSQLAPHAQEAAFVMRADGTDVRQLTDWDLDVGRIRWAPDGTYLVLSDKAENGTVDQAVDVWRVGFDGTALERITHNPPGAFAYNPELSPDGRRIVYVAWRQGMHNNELWTADPDGANPTRIWSGPDGWFLEWPAWSD